MQLYEHQIQALKTVEGRRQVAFYHTMGAGKTFTGSEQLKKYNNKYNLVICQKSKIDDWVEHFKTYYPEYEVIDFTKKQEIKEGIIVVNYELAWRRPVLTKLTNFTLMLDESSLISNENAKRTKFILQKLKPTNVILLSGTPVDGKYEQLWSQSRLLGWDISKKEFYDRYIITQDLNIKFCPFPIKTVVGYRNVEELKSMLRFYGANFLRIEDVLNLPETTFTTIRVDQIPEYKKFSKNKVVEIDGDTLVGDNVLTYGLYKRMLCSVYNKNKIEAFKDILDSTEERLIVFYNFNKELEKLKEIAKNRPISVVNGSEKNLEAYENENNSITFIQYQAGAMGLNLQKANKIIYFSLPLKCEYYMQSQKRIHRIGQERPCFYYILETKNSIEEDIKKSLEKKEDYTLALYD